MGDEHNADVPDSWLDVARKHRVAIAAAAVVLVGASIGLALWLTRDAREGGRVASVEKIPTDGAPSALPTSTGDATGSADATGSGGGDGSGEPDEEPANAWEKKAEPAPLVAYRMDGAVWVAREDGSEPRAVTSKNAGGYALSLDGRTLAFVDTSGKLPVVAFADVESGSVTKTGMVTEHPTTSLVWLAGDSAVVCVKDDAHLVRVPVKGGEEELIPIAAERTVFGTSPNGAVLAYLGPDAHTLTLRFPDETTRTIGLDDVSAVCCSYDRVFVSFLGSARIESMLLDGTYRQRLVGAPDTGLGSVWGDMAVSPDGSRITFSELFNDGYSRLYSARLDGSRMKPLWIRRDTYYLRWESDSGGVTFIEGNAFQGEPTKLMRASADGTGRKVLVENAFR